MTASRFAFEHSGKSYELSAGETLIGSGEECAVRLEGQDIEAVHAAAVLEDDKVVLRLRAEGKDVQINGRPTRVEDLEAGDRLRIGEVELTVVAGDPLVVLEGPSGSFEIRSGENTVGRAAEASVSLDEDSVSREHASILALPSGRVRIRDLSSSNGTFVNDRRLGEMVLNNGDKIEIGGERLIFVAVELPAGALGAAPGPPAADAAAAVPDPDKTRLAADVADLLAGPIFEIEVSGEIRILMPGSHKIGRAPDCQIQLTDDTEVSRYHSELTIGADGATVKDLGSRNGTRVNGERIGIEIELASGDKVGVGHREMLFKMTEVVDPMGRTVMAEDVLAVLGHTVLGPLGDLSAVEAMRDLPEDQRQALNLLELDASATEEEIRSRFKEMYSEFQIRTSNAPTPELKKKYENRVVEFRQAVELLIPPEEGAHSLPSAEPVEAPVGEAAPVPPAEAGVPPKAIEEAAMVDDAATLPTRKEKKGEKAKKPKERERSSVPGSTWAMAVILLIAMSASVFVFLQARKAAAIDRILQEEFDAKTQLIASMNEDIPRLTEEIVVLEEGKATMLENIELKICNLSPGRMNVTWLQASYVDEDGAIQTFDSAYHNYPTWPIEPGATGKFQYIVGDQTIWDGAAVFFAATISYGGRELFRSGAIQELGPDCYNLKLD